MSMRARRSSNVEMMESRRLRALMRKPSRAVSERVILNAIDSLMEKRIDVGHYEALGFFRVRLLERIHGDELA